MSALISFIVVVIVEIAVVSSQPLQADETTTLLSYTEESNEFCEEKILVILGSISYYSKERAAEIVVDTLYRADDKSIEIANGITVAQLIYQNNFELSNCTQAALKKRVDLFEQTKPPKAHQHGLYYAINSYLLECLIETCCRCLKNMAQVISGGHNDEKWMKELNAVRISDRLHPIFAQETVFNNITSNIVQYIKTGENIYYYSTG